MLVMTRNNKGGYVVYKKCIVVIKVYICYPRKSIEVYYNYWTVLEGIWTSLFDFLR